MSIPGAWMTRAMHVARPGLDAFREMDPDSLGKAEKEVIRMRTDAARVAVRRVVAALNGVDVEREIAKDFDERNVPVLLPRATVELLKRAMLNEVVVDAVETVIGERDLYALMEALSVL